MSKIEIMKGQEDYIMERKEYVPTTGITVVNEEPTHNQYAPELILEEELDRLKACGYLMLTLVEDVAAFGGTVGETEITAASLINENIEALCNKIREKLIQNSVSE